MLHIRNIVSSARRPESSRRRVIFAAAFTGTLCFLAASAAQDENVNFAHIMRQSMMQMHARMDAASTTGEPDHDFAAMMIPHHQGAIEMAKAELLYGKDPVMRRLAQEIIVDQQSEIEAMKHRLVTSGANWQRK